MRRLSDPKKHLKKTIENSIKEAFCFWPFPSNSFKRAFHRLPGRVHMLPLGQEILEAPFWLEPFWGAWSHLMGTRKLYPSPGLFVFCLFCFLGLESACGWLRAARVYLMKYSWVSMSASRCIMVKPSVQTVHLSSLISLANSLSNKKQKGSHMSHPNCMILEAENIFMTFQCILRAVRII